MKNQNKSLFINDKNKDICPKCTLPDNTDPSFSTFLSKHNCFQSIVEYFDRKIQNIERRLALCDDNFKGDGGSEKSALMLESKMASSDTISMSQDTTLKL